MAETYIHTYGHKAKNMALLIAGKREAGLKGLVKTVFVCNGTLKIHPIMKVYA